MNGTLQARINPHTSPNMRDVGTGKVRSTPKAIDGDGTGKIDFKTVLQNSNAEVIRKRAAQKNGDDLSAAKTDEEFFRMLSEKNNPNKPKPASQAMDKDAFLKLFVTQLQNQDPLNPDDSAKMAAQLAQFQGLEQSMNMNKTLEKMTQDQAKGRAVDLIGFVGKEVRLEGGRLRFDGTKVNDATFKVEHDVPNAVLEVRDGSGAVIGTKDLGNVTTGEHPILWDGMGKDGKKVRAGTYTFNIIASDAKGTDVPVSISSSVKVRGIDLQESGGAFYTDLGKVGIHEVASVGDTDFVKNAREAAAQEKAAAEAKAKAKAATPAVSAPMNGQAQQGPSPEELKAMTAEAAKAMADRLAENPGAAPATASESEKIPSSPEPAPAESSEPPA